MEDRKTENKDASDLVGKLQPDKEHDGLKLNDEVIQSVSNDIDITRKRRKGNTEDEIAQSLIDEDSLDEKNTKEKIVNAWRNIKNETDVENAFHTTTIILKQEIDAIIRKGVQAFHHLQNEHDERKRRQDELEMKEIELNRLQAVDEKNVKTISNLLRTIKKSRVEASNSAEHIMEVARLRAELNVATTKYNEEQGQSEGHKRRVTLIQEELHDVKIKLSRVTQEKIRMERDQRASLSLSKSLDNPGITAADLDFYKRKVSELNGNVQGLNAVVAEKNRQIDEMRRQIERNASKHRVDILRRLSSTSKR